MHIRPSPGGSPGQQLSFGDVFPEVRAPARLNRRKRITGAPQAVRSTPLPPASPAIPAPAHADGASRSAHHDDFATNAPANAYEQRARLRNSLTALITATDLMVRYAPDSPVLGELSAVVQRQIAQLTGQIQALEQIAAHCESADI